MTLQEVRKKLESKGYSVSFTQQQGGTPVMHGMMKLFPGGELVALDLEEAQDGNITFCHRTNFFSGTFSVKGNKFHHSFIDKPAFKISEERCRKLADLSLEFT